MENHELMLGCVAVYIIAVLVLLLLIARARPLQTIDGRTEVVRGGTTAPQKTCPAHVSSPVDVDGPPVTLKLPPAYSDGDLLVTCKRVLVITGCSNPFLWYADKIGDEVPYLGQWTEEKCYKSREPAGYINIVHFKDARVIIKEAGK